MPAYMLGPLTIVNIAVERLLNGEVLEQAAHSVSRAYAGFLIGGAVGVALGLLSGVSRVTREIFDVPQAFVHAIPKISLFPAVAVWLGFSDASRILIISLSCFFPAYLNAMSGALGINPRYLWLSRNNEIGSVRTFLQVVLPASLARTMVGLRISLMVAFILMVATEVIGHSDGLGSGVMLSYQDGDYPNMYAGILMIALAGFLSNWILQKIAAWLCRGQNLEFGG
jgi:ABC-type nitrate/sulfonate/bicarbonate transport system permease component